MARKIVIPLLIFIRSVFPLEQEIRVVVTDLFGDNVAPKNLAELTTTLEKELVKTGYFTCTDRSKLAELLKEYGVGQEECRTVPWLVKIGKALGVDKVVAGSVVNRGSVITVHIRTIDVQKQVIDRSATIVCRLCSIDDIYMKKMQRAARILAGLEEGDDLSNDSLFTFSPGPLVTLNKGAREDKKDISTKMGDQLFDDMWEMKSRRSGGAGILLFSFGTAAFLLHSIIWRSNPPGTGERIALYSTDVGLALLSVPFFVRSHKLGKGLPAIDTKPQSDVFEKGFKLGLSFNSFFKSTYESDGMYDPKAGAVADGFIRLNMGRHLSFQPELCFVQKRITLDESMPVDTRLTMNYLQLPLLLKCVLPVKGMIRPAAYLGPSLDWLMRATRTLKNNDGETEKEAVGGIRRFDVGCMYGLELALAIKKSRIFFEFRSEEGLADMGGFRNIPSNQNNRTSCFILGCSL